MRASLLSSGTFPLGPSRLRALPFPYSWGWGWARARVDTWNNSLEHRRGFRKLSGNLLTAERNLICDKPRLVSTKWTKSLSSFLEQPYIPPQSGVHAFPAFVWLQWHSRAYAHVLRSTACCKGSAHSHVQVFKAQPSWGPCGVDNGMGRKAPWRKVLCSGIFPGSNPTATLAPRSVFPKHKSRPVTLISDPSGTLLPVFKQFTLGLSCVSYLWLCGPCYLEKTSHHHNKKLQTHLAFKPLFL